MNVAVERKHPSLRRSLIVHKKFLYDLYQKNAVWCKRRLQKASVWELRTLIKFLVCLEQGHVDIRAKNYEALVRSKRVNQLIALRKRKNHYLTSSLSEKLKILNQFASLYRYLLEPLFYERKIKHIQN